MSQDGVLATIASGAASDLADLARVTEADIERLQSDRVCKIINEVDKFSALKFSDDLRKVFLRAWQLAAQLNSHTVAFEHLVVALEVTNLDIVPPSARQLPTVPPRPLLSGALHSISLMRMNFTIKLSALRPSSELETWIEEAWQDAGARHFLDVGDLLRVLHRTDGTSIGKKKLDQANTASELFSARRYIRSNEQTLSRFRSAALRRLANIDKSLKVVPGQPAVPINLDVLQQPINDIQKRVKQLRPHDNSGIMQGISLVDASVTKIQAHTQPLGDAIGQHGETLSIHGKQLAALDHTAAKILAGLPAKPATPPSASKLALYVGCVLALGMGAGFALQAAKEAGVSRQIAALWTANPATPVKPQTTP
jgi:ATP-dependent Clp protease ATP-binding subunit ClpA